MGSRQDYVAKKFGPLKSKTLQNALAQRINEQFPRIGGPRIQQLCAQMILEVMAQHVRPMEHLKHGQALWTAIAVDDPPGYRQKLTQVRLVPVVLDISTDRDINDRIDRVAPRERLATKAVRLSEQAFAQGGLLSNCDLAELLCADDSAIAAALTRHERITGKLVPRRATVHDVGTGLTHKRIICHKRYAEGKDVVQVARETYHSLESVDRYLGQYDRVRHCRLQGMDPHQTAHALGCGVALVREYLDIDQTLQGAHSAGTPASHTKASKRPAAALDRPTTAKTIKPSRRRIGQC